MADPTPCPCGSEQLLESCCGPFLSGRSLPLTAEQLMRSRYTAYVQRDIDYLEKSYDPATLPDLRDALTKEWMQRVEWLGLQVDKVTGGTPAHQQGRVVFTVRYLLDGKEQSRTENLSFRRVDGGWVYTDSR